MTYRNQVQEGFEKRCSQSFNLGLVRGLQNFIALESTDGQRSSVEDRGVGVLFEDLDHLVNKILVSL